MSRKARKAPAPVRTGATIDATAASGAAARVGGIDALRGIALCLMFIYHFSFDLRFYGVTHADFEHDPFWLGFRAVIVTSFMALVGLSLVLADRAGATPAHFWRRIGVIGACALGVSAASAVVFPRSYIYFGILHCIAVASVLAWPLVRRPRTAIAIGVVIASAGIVFSHPAFDEPMLSFLGFSTRKPVTEDYVALAPWAGAVFIGMALGHVLARHSFRALAPLAPAPAPLRWLGRHSLLVYMIHQPILLGVLWLVVRR